MKVKRCTSCGDLSVPYFGFFAPCRADSVGGHRELEPFEEDEVMVARRLRVAYSSVPWFDRAKFDKYASAETKALIQRRRPNA